MLVGIRAESLPHGAEHQELESPDLPHICLQAVRVCVCVFPFYTTLSSFHSEDFSKSSIFTLRFFQCNNKLAGTENRNCHKKGS